MGQSSSTPRDHRRISLSHHFALFRTERDQGNRGEVMNHGRNFGQAGESHPWEMELSDDNIQTSAGYSTDISGGSDPLASRPIRDTQEENGPELGLGEEFRLGQQGYRSATFARLSSRRQSTVSRLGSRILPNSVIRGLLSSQEETPAEGHAHRHGVSSSIPRTEAVHSNSRFGPFSSLGSRGIMRRRSFRAPYSIPRSDTTPTPDALDPSAERAPESGRGSWRRSARLHRVRRSLSNPISQMLGHSSVGMESQTPVTVPHTLGPPHLFPPARALGSHMDLDEPHELDSVEPAIHNNRSVSPVSNHSAQDTPNAGPVPSFLRAQPSRVLRRDEQTPLSRVLQLAAAAIAAQLSGTTGPVLPNIQSLGNDGLDGSLDNFIQSLQNATSAQTNPLASNDSPNGTGDNTPSPPVNFLRVFRFANSDAARAPGTTNRSMTGSDNTGNQADGMNADNQTEGMGTEGRTVTLVAVGVRSVPSSNGDQPSPGQGLDALLRLPFLAPGIRNSDGGPNLPTRSDGPSRLFPSRYPVGGPSALAANNDTLHQPGSSNASRRLSDTGAGIPNSLPESPPGPNPPPSTPAEPGLSGASTPSRRPSSASTMSPYSLPQVHDNQSMQPTVEPAEDDVPRSIARQRRRSDSEYDRHRDLGSGSVRRNGVVEPDNANPPVGRSWLIYVVGTNLSENHPAFATPSLFTDVRPLSINMTLSFGDYS